MRATTWRTLLLILCGLSAFVVVVAFAVFLGLLGSTGYDIEPAGTPFVERVTAVAPGGGAEAAGIRPDDLIDLRDASPSTRYRVVGPGYALGGGSWFTRGVTVDLRIIRDGTARTVRLTTRPANPYWQIWLVEAGNLWMIAFGALLVWRRPENVEARVLCLWLLGNAVGPSISPGNELTPWPFVDLLIGAAGLIIANLVIALFATYGMLFARPASTTRRVLAWLSYLSAGATALFYVLGIIGVWTGRFDLVRDLNVSLVLELFEWLFPLLCVIGAVAASRGLERQRLLWTSSALGLFYAVFVAAQILQLLAPAFAFGSLSNVVNEVLDTAAFLVPLGMTYALLSRRILDIGFVLNRAAVFSGVSIIVVGIFILVKWAIGERLGSGLSSNAAVGAGLAVILGFSMNFIHSHVDGVLDRVFFKKRHEDEQAIRHFATEAAYIVSRETLLQRTIEVLERHADASFVRIVPTEGDDPAFVKLRAWHSVLDLHTVQTEIPGEWAYPMVARGRLVGALVLGAKRSGESYAPDESAAIAQLAHSVAGALEILSLKSDEATVTDAIAGLRRELAALRRDLEQGSALRFLSEAEK